MASPLGQLIALLGFNAHIEALSAYAFVSYNEYYSGFGPVHLVMNNALIRPVEFCVHGIYFSTNICKHGFDTNAFVTLQI